MVTFTYYTFKSFATKNLLVRIEGYIDYDKFISSIINKLQNRMMIKKFSILLE